jgi:hypothetical protein
MRLSKSSSAAVSALFLNQSRSQRAVVSAVLLLLITPLVYAQQTGIYGRVSDASQWVVPAVSVTLTSDGLNLQTKTNGDGSYQFPALRGSSYTLLFHAAGFADLEKKVTVLVGQNVEVNATLALATASSIVTVTSAPASLEMSSSEVTGNIDPVQMNQVPLNGRNWMELAMMVPGVTRNAVSASPLGANDQGKYQINIDGQQVTQTLFSDSYGQPFFSRDVIDQYQIITNRFDATLGRSLQMQVNAQTKSGVDALHGSAFAYFRNDAFNASDPVAKTVLPFQDEQYGFTLGGPIRKGKIWYFGGFEGENNPSTLYTSPIGFNQTFTLPENLFNETFLLRGDWQLNDRNRIFVRGHGFYLHDPFNGVGGTTYPALGTDRTRDGYDVLGDWTWTKSASLVNDLRVGVNHFTLMGTSVVNGGMQFDFGEGSAGANYNDPDTQNQLGQQYRDDVFVLRGRHSFKFGGEFLRTYYSGVFKANSRGQVLTFSSDPANLSSYFPVWNDPSTWNLAGLSPYASSYVQGFGTFQFDVPTNAIALWAQDDWKILPRLTLNLGLRYDNDLNVFNTGISIPYVTTPKSGSDLMFGPRVGFAYDPFADHKTVIRAGAGVYFADIIANQVIDESLFNSITVIQPSIQATAGHPINLLDPFNGVTGEQFLTGQVPVSLQTIQPLAPSVRTPYSLQYGAGVSHEFGSSWTLTADYVHWHVHHDWAREDENLYFNPATGYNCNPSTCGRPNSHYNSISAFQTPGWSRAAFNSLQIGLQHQISHHFVASVAYTLAKMMDSSTGAFFYANNQFNGADEYANSADDQRHTLQSSLSYFLKYGFQLGGLFHYGSGNAYATTAGGNPFNASVTNRTYLATTKTYDNPACNVPSIAAGYMEVKRDCFYGSPIYRFDAKLAKTFTIHERIKLIPTVEAFNAFNHANFGAYSTVITASTFGHPAQNTALGYGARQLQFSGRIEF